MKSGKLCLWSGVFGTVLGVSWIVNAAGREEMLNAGTFLFLVSLFVLIPVGLRKRSKTKREAYNALSEVDRERIEVERAQKAEEAAEKWKQMKEEIREANTIVSTAIVDTTSKSKTKASASSSVVRGAVGGALFGTVGMVAGAVTPKKTTITKAKTVTFSVRYANGECKLETVKNGSARFKELAKYIA